MALVGLLVEAAGFLASCFQLGRHFGNGTVRGLAIATLACSRSATTT